MLRQLERVESTLEGLPVAVRACRACEAMGVDKDELWLAHLLAKLESIEVTLLIGLQAQRQICASASIQFSPVSLPLRAVLRAAGLTRFFSLRHHQPIAK